MLDSSFVRFYYLKEGSMNLEEKLAQASSESDTALTIGVFDGVHRGHQHLISHLQNAALKNRLLAGIITFDRHPQEIFTPEITLPYLTTKKEREHLLRELKVKLIVTIPFTLQTAQMSARQFVNLLCRYLKMKRFVIGPDTTFGRDKEGNSALLQALGKEMGFIVEVSEYLMVDGLVVSSTAIRSSLISGNIQMANKLLGRNFYIEGQVTPGVGHSKTIGFPTANLELNPERATIADGVYATKTHIANQEYSSVTNVGDTFTVGRMQMGINHPLVQDNQRIAETHIFNFDGNLMGKEIRVDFLRRLRDEKQFSNTGDLKAQISIDIEQAKALFIEK